MHFWYLLHLYYTWAESRARIQAQSVKHITTDVLEVLKCFTVF